MPTAKAFQPTKKLYQVSALWRLLHTRHLTPLLCHDPHEETFQTLCLCVPLRKYSPTSLSPVPIFPRQGLDSSSYHIRLLGVLVFDFVSFWSRWWLDFLDVRYSTLFFPLETWALQICDLLCSAHLWQSQEHCLASAPSEIGFCLVLGIQVSVMNLDNAARWCLLNWKYAILGSMFEDPGVGSGATRSA